ncbi:hypothetical protein [Bacillus sp. 03113]|uniref:hypothetical protein n=1 Tax=Bacillus sp. 03113 TaxID=2578211 RepID=UPI0011411D38|nr:hypothetical protein [Bacillus sp. 03113]
MGKKYSIKWVNSLIVLCSFLSIGFLLWTQLRYLNQFAASWDQVDYALALDRYDMMAMQPHFPGYPYFILGGFFVHLFVEDKAASLTTFNILVYFSALFPMYKLAREYVSKSLSFLLAAILYSSSYIILTVNQPMSEGAAIGALWWYFWSIQKAMKENTRFSNVLPLFLFSVLLGIRLSYVSFAIGLGYLFYRKWRDKQYDFKKIAAYSALAIGFQVIWVTALIISEGSLIGFIKLSLAFTSGHFNDWGNTAIVSEVPFLERVYILIVDTFFWNGAASQSILLAILCIILFGIGLSRVKMNELKNDFIQKLTLLMGASYFLWVLFAQNIDKPRHVVPVVIFIFFLVLIHVVSKKSSLFSIFCLFLLVSQTIQSALLVKEQAHQIPATYQLSQYVNSLKEPSVLYTWEESRVLDYLHVAVPHKEIKTYDVFEHDQSYYKNHNILITNKTLEGFKSQGVKLSGKIKKVAEFRSNSLFDPVYHHIVVYKYVGKKIE